MDKNLQAYIKLDKNKLANQYVVIIEGNPVATGTNIEEMLKVTRRKYPHKTPFVAKVPDQQLLVLILITHR